MEDTYTIGLDYGTLSGRGILVRLKDGKIIASAQKEYPHGIIEHFLPGDDTPLPSKWRLQHPDDYLIVLEYIVAKLLECANIQSKQIVAIGVDFTASTVMPIDVQGIPLCTKEEFSRRRNAYVKLWKHHSAQPQADTITRVLGQLNQAHSPKFGGSISAELMAPKALEILQEDPAIYENAVEIIEAGDWITRVLTGSNKRSCSFAGYKAWWDAKSGYPQERFFEKIDIRFKQFAQDKLPGQICGIGEAAGTLSHEWANRLRLKEGTLIAPAMIDSHAGVAGCGIQNETQGMLVLGTSSVLIALGDQPYSQKGVYGGVKDAIVPGYYALESGLAAVGDLFAWYVDTMVPMHYFQEAQSQNIDIFQLLNNKAALLEGGRSALLALDWWSGNKTPFVDGNLSGSIIGLTLHTKPEQIYQALIEATAFGTRQIVDLYIENGAVIEEIIASGSVALKNPFCMQIYADVLGVTIKVATTNQAAALGSAIYASLVAGCEQGGYDTYEEAVKKMAPAETDVYLYDAVRKLQYDKLYALYKDYSAMMGVKGRSILKALAQINE